jgi:hypothetical protein
MCERTACLFDLALAEDSSCPDKLSTAVFWEPVLFRGCFQIPRGRCTRVAHYLAL